MTGMPDLPRRSRAVAAGCLLAMVAAAGLLHREVLFGGDVYHMDDAADGYYPGHIAVSRAFAAGELPTWERGSWCGWPLVVDPYNGVFYPLNVLYYAIGAARGLGFAIALHILLGGVGMWLLLRRRGLGDGAALLGALAYELSSFGVVRIRHVIFVQMMAWLPWILWAVERWLAERRWRDLALVAAATGLALVAGALSIGHFAALAIAGYTIAACVPPAAGAPPLARTRRFAIDAGLLAAAAVLGAMLAAAQIVPTVAHLPYSPRALASDYHFASSYAWPGIRYFWTLLAPDLYGGEDRAAYRGLPNHWELAGYCVGVVPWLLAPLSLLLRARGPRRGRIDLLVLAGLTLLALALAQGDAAPLHRFFYRHLPLYAALRCPARALLIVVIAIPILAAHGAQSLVERLPGSSRVAWTWPAAAAGVAGGAAVFLLRGHGPIVEWTRTHLVAGQAVAERVRIPSGVDPEAVRHALAVGLLAAAIFALAMALRAPARALVAALVLLAAGDLMAIDRGYVALYHKPADQPAGMERFAAVEWVLAHAGPPWQERLVNDPRGPFRLHNIGMVLGLESASGYDSVAVWRYVQLLHLLRFGHPYPFHELRDDFAAIGVWNLDSHLLDLMNVRWLLAAEPPGRRWVERFHASGPSGPPGHEGGPAARWEPVWNGRLNVYENTTVLPRAFIAHRAEVPGSDERLAARIVEPGFDPGRTVLLEEPIDRAAAGGGGPPVAARILRAGRHELVIETDDVAPGVLVVSEAHYPGWSATVDGRATKLLRADWAFRGVALTAGHHRVVMRYRSRPVEVGIALSLLALAAVIGLAASGRRPLR